MYCTCRNQKKNWVVQHPSFQINQTFALRKTKKDEAKSIFFDITRYNQTKAKKLCPKPCQQYIISFNKEERNISLFFTTLEMQFPKYIRVSSSYYSYTILELLAEVGGYFGLFLGVSIIQISGLMEILMAKLDQYVKNWRENSP